MTITLTALIAAGALGTPALPAAAPRPVSERYAEGTPTPRNMTPEEASIVAAHPIQAPSLRQTAPPTGVVRAPAEYEPMEAIIIAWEGNSGWRSILGQMTAQITTVGDADVWVYVDSSSEQSSVTSTLTSAGADMSRVFFRVKVTDTIWCRDYGPQYIYQDGVRAACDHTYNRPRPNDNSMPADYASARGHLYYESPLVHGGGNYQLAQGVGFATELIGDENRSLTDSQIEDIWLDYWGVDTTITDALPSFIDSTQHIDMWMQMAAPDHVVISDWPTQSGTSQDIVCDTWATELAARGFTVTRIPAFSVSGTHYTYTNVVVCNDLVLVPTYTNSSVSSSNATAIATWESVFPAKAIVPINCQSIVTYAGVMHCITKHIPANSGGTNPVAALQAPAGAQTFDPGELVSMQWISDDDVATDSVDVLLSTNGGASFAPVATDLPDTGTYYWSVPDVGTSNAVLRLVVRDGEGNTGYDDTDAPITITGTPPCAADMNGDGSATADDIALFVTFFTDAQPTNADIDADGDEDADDIAAFVNSFVAGCAAL